MSCMQLSEGGFQVVYPLTCGPGHPELSKSYTDMASESFAFTFTCCAAMCALIARCHTQAKQPHVSRAHRTRRIGRAREEPPAWECIKQCLPAEWPAEWLGAAAYPDPHDSSARLCTWCAHQVRTHAGCECNAM